MTEEAVTFESADGAHLAGRLHAAEDAAAGGVVVAHPHPLYGGDKDSFVVRAITDACAVRGLLALRFDFRHAGARGIGEDVLLRDADADLRAAVEALRARLPQGAAVGVSGYSFGGTVALRTWRRTGARALACVGLPVKGPLRDAVPWDALADAARPPVLVTQGQYDDFGRPADVEAAFAAAGVPVDVRTVRDASHGYFGEADEVGRAHAEFLAKRLA